jgi:hypothetical protein
VACAVLFYAPGKVIFPDDEIHISMNCSYWNVVTTTAIRKEKVQCRLALGRNRSASGRIKYSASGSINSTSGRTKSALPRISTTTKSS